MCSKTIVLKPFIANEQILAAVIKESNMLDKYPDFLNVKQVSDILGVCSVTVRSMLNEHILFGQKAKQRWVIPKVALCAWLLGEEMFSDS